MGHANLSNLSRLFVRHLYAKGKLSINDAVAYAIKKGEKVQASEAEYDDEGMLSFAFNDIVLHLSSEDGRHYSYRGEWEGPFIVPVDAHRLPSFCPKGCEETETVRNLLRTCADLSLKKADNILENEMIFGVCADAIQEQGTQAADEWAERIRTWPRQHWLWVQQLEHNYDPFDEEINWKAYDAILWKFANGWRAMYKEIPLLSNVTH